MGSIPPHPLRWKLVIPHAIVILWVIYLGAMMWQHDVRSVQPPIYDSLGYMQKAMNFWNAFDRGELFNPLNLEPASRPPGTILMTYPFGFSPSSEGLHFRSVFFPVVCIILAVYMAAGMPRNAGEGWNVAAAAILLSAAPMFYIFDLNEANPKTSCWGLVDTFQAGIAALATAGIARSLKEQSQAWLLTGASLGSLALFIKPSGLMIMALLTAIWLIVVIVEWVWAKKESQSNKNLYRYVIIGGISSFLIYSVAVLLAFFSRYFSSYNFAYAKQALKVMEDVLKRTPSQILSLVFDSAGLALVLWIFGNFTLIIFYCLCRNKGNAPIQIKMVGMVLSIPVVWSLGAWYWLVVQAGGSQVRYFFPFFMMGVICLIPIALHIIHHSNRWLRQAHLLVCFLSALNIGVLLAFESPSIAWQRFTGVNVSVGQDREEVNQAYAFIDELRRQNRSGNLYSLSSSILPDIFVNVGLYEAVIRPEQAVFHTVLSVDWLRGFVVRTHEILEADFILIRNDVGFQAEQLLNRPIDSFQSECIVFQAWLCKLDENAGLKRVSDGRVLRLIEIIDRKAFAEALELFVSKHSWRPVFIAANSQRHWWSEEDILEYTKDPDAKNIDFQGIFLLHALSLQRSNTGLRVEFWWEESRHEEANQHRHIFFHLVDDAGNIVRDIALPLDKYVPPFHDRRCRYGSATFDPPLPKEATSLGFGIFGPENEILLPDKGIRDWGGKRVLVSIPAGDW